ncbi:hypothetical protein EVG20_g11316 [Dentipellis fragilis]|uniref:Uncharacterized protein n=1 Tax=Dentipellis fragilis TaxID=205917 RepID=A0A4Y9XM48_9AGAM|nr:hypothetical protein EVG20_g11316 [Dentipellis fragilis]
MAFTSPSPFGPIGYIVMEYIAAPEPTAKSATTSRSRAPWIGSYTSRRRAARCPDILAVGRWCILSMFCEWDSGIKYESGRELQDHVNGVRGPGVPPLADETTHDGRVFLT